MQITTVVNLRDRPHDIYIGRGSIWGNPFIEGKHGDRSEVIDLYRQYVLGSHNLLSQIHTLKGKVLGCYCKPAPCHGDVLANLSNGVLKMYNRLCIGIDQSYTRTGISIAVDGRLIKVSSMAFRGCTCKTEKRKLLSKVLSHILEVNKRKASDVIIICERIRTFSHSSGSKGEGNQGDNQMFISTDYIKATGALMATVVDAAYDHGIKVYSADTRAWKSSIVGSIKSIKGNKKLATVNFIIKKGFSTSIASINRKGKEVYDDDAADSGCIALYGFVKDAKLKLEQ